MLYIEIFLYRFYIDFIFVIEYEGDLVEEWGKMKRK
jgi:hypothetical protein